MISIRCYYLVSKYVIKERAKFNKDLPWMEAILKTYNVLWKLAFSLAKVQDQKFRGGAGCQIQSAESSFNQCSEFIYQIISNGSRGKMQTPWSVPMNRGDKCEILLYILEVTQTWMIEWWGVTTGIWKMSPLFNWRLNASEELNAWNVIEGDRIKQIIK